MKAGEKVRKSNKVFGDAGEQKVVELIECPNCTKQLMLLPPSFPLYDVQCSACNFRAQIKSSNSSPKEIIRGAGWEIMHKVLKAGHLVPPLITHFEWQNSDGKNREIRFYPFISRKSLKKYTAHILNRGDYAMFNYSLKDEEYYLLHRSVVNHSKA